MTPDQIAAAAPLLEKRATLVHANEHAGPDYVYYLRSRYKTLEVYDICRLETDEIQYITEALIDSIDEILESLGVDISGLP